RRPEDARRRKEARRAQGCVGTREDTRAGGVGAGRWVRGRRAQGRTDTGIRRAEAGRRRRGHAAPEAEETGRTDRRTEGGEDGPTKDRKRHKRGSSLAWRPWVLS